MESKGKCIARRWTRAAALRRYERNSAVWDEPSHHRDEERQGGSQGCPTMAGGKAPQFMGDESWTENSPDISWHLNHVSPWMFSAHRSASMSCRLSSGSPWAHQIVVQRSATGNGVFAPLVFSSWLHLGSLSGCAEPLVAESRGPAGSRQPRPCG